jgi:acylphosphatase
VQGVGFRWFVQRSARDNGVVGWVRNLPDGDVELHAEGESAAVERLAQDVRQGPRGSRVDRYDLQDVSVKGTFGDFEITY